MGKLDNAKYFLRIKLDGNSSPIGHIYEKTIDLFPGTHIFLDVGSVGSMPWAIPLVEPGPVDWIREDLIWHVESDDPRCLVEWQYLITGAGVSND
jgi:hypothetical protein